MKTEYETPLDPGIARAVHVLQSAGIETYESCQGGKGHTYKEPTVRFHGERAAGFRALAAALENGLPVDAIRRVWIIQDGEPVGPDWEITFWEPVFYPRGHAKEQCEGLKKHPSLA